MSDKELFVKIPNKYIQCNIKNEFGISRKFYVIYFLIGKYRTYENYSWITIRKVFEFYGYKTTKHKPKIYYEIIDVLKYMCCNNHIFIRNNNLDSISYDTGIEIEINPNIFDVTDKFAKLTSNDFNIINRINSSINKENLLLVYLYILSYIGHRPKNDDGTEKLYNYSEFPEAYYGSIDIMAKTLSMAKNTISKSIDELIKNKMIKMGNCNTLSLNNKLINLPNIYVLNTDSSDTEIQMAKDKIIKFHKKEGEQY